MVLNKCKVYEKAFILVVNQRLRRLKKSCTSDTFCNLKDNKINHGVHVPMTDS